jgi:tetrahydromethanopterin S-methyltransferase subunit F
MGLESWVVGLAREKGLFSGEVVDIFGGGAYGFFFAGLCG